MSSTGPYANFRTFRGDIPAKKQANFCGKIDCQTEMVPATVPGEIASMVLFSLGPRWVRALF